MCGLAAIFRAGHDIPAALLEGMAHDMYHRGPDSGGVLAQPGWGLAFRRLAILDPQAGADQPMQSADGLCTLVFNGEIYNFTQLRNDLIAAGVALRTRGDTEVILEGYRLWGEGVLERLEGMYAFVLVDRRSGVAIAARDPLGIKPLYLLKQKACIAVASEMRPLYRLIRPEPDTRAVAELLTFNWAAGRLSNVRGIERVPGGTLLRIDLKDGTLAERRFCNPLDTLRPDASTTPEMVGDALERSVHAHLASDVGYTMQLSGGVDSSVVAALAQQATPTPIQSFGVQLSDPRFDEGPYRHQVAERYGLDHREVPLSGQDFADALPRAVAHMEGPVPHGGCVMLMRLCDEIRQHGKVVLTGEGADEAFGGYIRYAWWKRLAWQERLGRLLPAAFWPATSPFLGIRRLHGLDAAVYGGVTQNFRALHTLFPDLVPPAPGDREAQSRRFRDFRDRLLAVDQTAYLESLLVRQDKMSMAASVEARVPFVHMPFWRIANALPRDLRIPGGTTKPVLKAFAARLLPHDLVYRRKVGLRLPYEEWLAEDTMLGRYLELLTDTGCRLAAFGNRAGLRNAVEGFRKGAPENRRNMFVLVNTELWLRDIAARCTALSDPEPV
ncbi:MAG: asparagine synthase (glutamine-hydrolyzing) [Alphaproteobacteria bacterium]